MFSLTLCQTNLKSQQSPDMLDLCLEKTQAEKSHDYCETILSKSSVHFSKCFLSTRKQKATVFKKRFQKAPFSQWISVDGRPQRRNKAAF